MVFRYSPANWFRFSLAPKYRLVISLASALTDSLRVTGLAGSGSTAYFSVRASVLVVSL